MKIKAVVALLSFLFALVGCTKSEDLPFEGGTHPTDNILLSVESSDGESFTRGSVVDSEAKMGSVGMFCAHTVADDWSASLSDFNKMDNAKFSYESNAWVWKAADNNGSEQPTWGHSSLTEKYTFFAYSPHQATDVSIADGEPQIRYTVTPTVAGQVDFMAAKPRKNIHPQSGGKVHMEFEYALTKVSFSVKGVNSRKIKSITIKDVHNNGTLTFNDASPYFEWSSQNGSQSYTVSTSADGGNGAINDIEPNIDETTATTLTTESGYLFMLPQSVTGKQMDIVIINADASESIETLTLPDSWTQGTHTNYIIALVINEVDLAVNVTSWDDKSIEPNVQGTYLNILDKSLGIFDGEDALIYYATDHSPDSEVVATYTKIGEAGTGTSLTKHTDANGGNYFNFPTSSSNLSSGDYIVTIEAGSHLARKLKVTVKITGDVVVSLIAWDDKPIEPNVQGTYLNILDKSLGILDGEDALIYYATDHSPDSEVVATYTKSGEVGTSTSLTKHTVANGGHYFNFPTYSSNLSSGDYIVTINAGSHLTRKLKVSVIYGDVVVSPIAWDDNDMNESTEGTHLTLSHAELDISAGGMIPIYYSTDAESVSSSVDNDKISLDTSVDGKITITAANDIIAPATLEIRADKIIKKININIK